MGFIQPVPYNGPPLSPGSRKFAFKIQFDIVCSRLPIFPWTNKVNQSRNSTLAKNSYRSRVKSLFNYLYQLQKQINTTKQTIRTFEEILKDISEMELAFLAEIYDRILKDNEVFYTIFLFLQILKVIFSYPHTIWWIIPKKFATKIRTMMNLTRLLVYYV